MADPRRREPRARNVRGVPAARRPRVPVEHGRRRDRVCLFDPAADALPEAPAGSWPLSHPALADTLAAIAHTLGYRMI
jgi:hypothetical protein